jgi:hypothetical protein
MEKRLVACEGRGLTQSDTDDTAFIAIQPRDEIPLLHQIKETMAQQKKESPGYSYSTRYLAIAL